MTDYFLETIISSEEERSGRTYVEHSLRKIARRSSVEEEQQDQIDRFLDFVVTAFDTCGSFYPSAATNFFEDDDDCSTRGDDYSFYSSWTGGTGTLETGGGTLRTRNSDAYSYANSQDKSLENMCKEDNALTLIPALSFDGKEEDMQTQLSKVPDCNEETFFQQRIEVNIENSKLGQRNESSQNTSQASTENLETLWMADFDSYEDEISKALRYTEKKEATHFHKEQQHAQTHMNQDDTSEESTDYSEEAASFWSKAKASPKKFLWKRRKKRRETHMNQDDTSEESTDYSEEAVSFWIKAKTSSKKFLWKQRNKRREKKSLTREL